MGIGNVIENHFETYTDPYTKRKVTRLTAPDHTSHHMYFYNRMTTGDGKKLLYSAETDGERNLYLMDLETGTAVQLTEGKNLDDFSGVITDDDKFVVYQQDNAIWKESLATFERKCIYRPAEGWNCGNWGMSKGNRYLALAETRVDTLPDRTGMEGWDFFRPTCAAKPLCHLVYLDTETLESHIVIEDRCWFGHAQINPGNPNDILFCHEGPYDMIDARLWLVNSDGSSYRCAREQPSDLIITHEFWLPDGEKFCYVYRETTGEKAESIRMMRPEDLKEEIFMPCRPYAHFICDHTMRYMVGDSQGKLGAVTIDQGADKTADQEARGEAGTEDGTGEIKDDFIYLVDMEKREEIRLCYHGTSWGTVHGTPQDAHPHPCFTADDRAVLFTSDREGKPCIYRIEI